MSDAPAVHVHIFGTEYKLASDADPDHTRNVSQYVDQKMREIASTLSLRSVAKIAVLTAVNLADELLKEEEVGRRLDQAATECASRLAKSATG